MLCCVVCAKVLTLLGFLHICMQPYFCHVINCSLTKNAKYIDRYIVIKRLCIIGGGMLFARHFLAALPGYSTMDFKTGGTYTSTEWLRGEKLCTFKGAWHLAWSVPMADPTYVIPGAAIHSFCMSVQPHKRTMRKHTAARLVAHACVCSRVVCCYFRFAPFFALYEKRGMVVQGIFLFVFGPMLAGWISPNLMEQASIWCFFSIAQIAIMLFCIRETLITNWGKDKTHTSLLTGQGGNSKVAPKDEAERVTRGSSKKKSKHAE